MPQDEPATTTNRHREKLVAVAKDAWVGWTFGFCALGLLLGREIARPTSTSGMPCILTADDLSRGEAAVLERLENDIASWRLKSVETASVLEELYGEMGRLREAAEAGRGRGDEDGETSRAAEEATAAAEQVRSFSEAAEARLEAIETQAAETKTALMEAAAAQRKKLDEIEAAALREARAAVESATSPAGNDKQKNLDDLRTLVDEAARRYVEGDRVGEFDYALGAAGASVVASLTSEPYTPPDRVVPTWLWHAVGRDAGVGRPEDAIDAKMSFGSCFAFQGSSGNLTVETATGAVRPTSFTVEHIHAALCNPVRNKNCSSAPRHFEVLGRTSLDEQDGDPPVLLGKFRYDAMTKRPSLQKFQVDPSLYQASEPNATAFPYITLDVKDNHGHANYTCIYRFRVHGEHAAR